MPIMPIKCSPNNAHLYPVNTPPYPKCNPLQMFLARNTTLNGPLHGRAGREPDGDGRVRLAVEDLILRGVAGLLVGLGNRHLSLAPFPVRPLEVLSARLVLGDHVVEGLTLDRGGLADLPCADAPDDVRGEYAGFEEAAGVLSVAFQQRGRPLELTI